MMVYIVLVIDDRQYANLCVVGHEDDEEPAECESDSIW